MALTQQSVLTQETFDMIAAEMLVRADDNFSFLQLVTPQESNPDAGAKTITFNAADLPAGTYSEASRRLTEGTAIAATSKAITMSTKTLTIREYGGPYDNTAAGVIPFGITDKLRRMAKHDVVNIIGGFMRRDRNKFINQVRMDDMLSATIVVTPDGSAEGVVAAGQTASAAWLRALNKQMKDTLVPSMPNGRWNLILTTTDEKNLKADPEINAAFREFAAANSILLNGALGQYEGFNIYIDTLVPTKAVGAGGLVTGYQSLAYGPLHLGHAELQAPEVRQADDTDFGRQQRILWVSLEAFGSLYVADYVVRGITT